jgi:adenosylhomocysteine nucleosidase
VTVLVVAPTRREAAACGTTIVCGSGERAAEVAGDRLRETKPELLLIAGVCGGLDPSLAPGNLILCRRLLAEGKPELVPDRGLLERVQGALRASRRQFVSSTLLSVERPVGSREEKRDLWNTYGAAGVDMESYQVAAMAAEHGVPWLVLRAVLDPAGSALPSGVLSWRDESDEREIVGRIARRPADWPAYARLAVELQRALRALRQCVPVVLEAASSEGAGAESSPRRAATRE